MWHGPEHWLQSNEQAQLQERLEITYNFDEYVTMEE